MFRTLGLTIALSTCVLATALSVRISAQKTPVGDIIDRALVRAAWSEEQGIRTRYRFTLASRSQKLEKDGSVREEAREVYDVAPVRGVPFARLMSKDGQALEGKDLGDERKRYAKFVARLENGTDDNDEDDSFIRLAASGSSSSTRSVSGGGSWDRYPRRAAASIAGRSIRRTTTPGFHPSRRST